MIALDPTQAMDRQREGDVCMYTSLCNHLCVGISEPYLSIIMRLCHTLWEAQWLSNHSTDSAVCVVYTVEQ